MAVSLALDGKVALVTGGSRGIGAETVRLFCQAGAQVAFSYRQARKQAEALVAECARAGDAGRANCIAIEQELVTPADGSALVEKAVAAFGRLDILVANHGIWESEDVPITEMSDVQWRHTIAVNLDAVFGLVRAAVARMGNARSNLLDESGARGHIVLISSTAGQRGEAYHADYAVTKGALDQSYQEPVERACGQGDQGKLCCAGMGGYGYVGGDAGASDDGAADRSGNPRGPRGDAKGDCRAGRYFCVRRLPDSSPARF